MNHVLVIYFTVSVFVLTCFCLYAEFRSYVQILSQGVVFNAQINFTSENTLVRCLFSHSERTQTKMSANLIKNPLLFSSTLTMILFFFFPLLINCQCNRNPVAFIFGDSNSDTGAYYSGLGLMFGVPNGRTYFNQPSGRLCDGRLVIDLLCKSN